MKLSFKRVRAYLPVFAARDTLFIVMHSLLAVTSDNAFGELIRQNLEETGRFNVHITGESKNAVAHAQEVNCPLAFLDSSLGEKKVSEIGALLRQANPEIHFIVISEAGWHSPLFEELSPDGYLSKPFYIPDLLDMMDRLLNSSQPSKDRTEPGADGDLSWLSDVARAAQHLTRLTLEASAQAALITRNDQLWAYSGQLPQSATRELAETVSRYWDRQEENDLVRFVHLASTKAEHMLYATRLAPDTVLALIFDAETPFGTIRTQANQLIHSLSESSSDKRASQQLDDDETPPLAPISDILSDIPSPNPTPYFSHTKSKSLEESSPAIPLPSASFPRFSRESSPATPLRQAFISEEIEASVNELEKTVESPTIPRKSRIRKGEYEEGLEDTRPSSVTEATRKTVLEPVSQSVYSLDYACLLIPRFAKHHLTGDLLERLGEWIPQTCIAFGWRLEYISVRPDYLQWIANVPPATSPGYLMRIMRQHTSEKIFEEFPRLKKDNPSGDFWAPGYLIMGGMQPPPAHLIKDFIAQTRQRQGISHQPR